ncbi:MAG: CHAP domain-containing protein [Candidatus Dormibacterales bacterium]
MTVISRYVVHAVVLTIAIVVSGYAAVTHEVPASAGVRLGIVNAAGLVIGQGGKVGDVTLGRMSTVIKPIAVPTSAPVSHAPITFTVHGRQTLAGIAARFNLTVDDIRWSNAALSGSTSISSGEVLMLPPVQGVVVTVRKGETVNSIAHAYHTDANSIVDFNYLRDPSQLVAGERLVVPSGEGKQFADTQPAPVTLSGGPGSIIVRFASGPAVYSSSKFPYGYCTWYVNSRRPVPWSGDAWTWFSEAQAYGWKTGQTPRVGAIMVTWESGWGHVAYVESVHPGGSWTVSEMNYVGWGVVDQRTIHPGQVPLIGFIY